MGAAEQLAADLRAMVDDAVDRKIAALVAEGRLVVVDADQATADLDRLHNVTPTVPARRRPR